MQINIHINFMLLVILNLKVFLTKKGLKLHCQEEKEDDWGKFIFLKGTLELKQIMIASIYTPNNRQISFLDQIFQVLVTFKGGKTIIADNFNYVADLALDRTF